MNHTFEEFLNFTIETAELRTQKNGSDYYINASESAMRVAKYLSETKSDYIFDNIWWNIGKIFTLALHQHTLDGGDTHQFCAHCQNELLNEKIYSTEQQIAFIKVFIKATLESNKINLKSFFRVLRSLQVSEDELRFATLGIVTINKNPAKTVHLKDNLLGALYTSQMKTNLNDSELFISYLANEIENFEVKLFDDHYRLF